MMVLNKFAQFWPNVTRGSRVFRSFVKEFSDFRLMFAEYQRFRNRKCIMVLKSTAANERSSRNRSRLLQRKKSKEVGKIQRRPRRQVLNVRFPERVSCTTKDKKALKKSARLPSVQTFFKFWLDFSNGDVFTCWCKFSGISAVFTQKIKIS